MKLEKKWAKVTALALSLPSTIFGAAFLCFKLYELSIISKLVAVLIFLAVIFNILFAMVVYAIKNKS